MTLDETPDDADAAEPADDEGNSETPATSDSQDAASPETGDLEQTEAPDPQNAVEIRGLGKAFRGVRVIDGLDLTVPSGSFYGIAGPNGAGKTTLLSMMTGLMRPDRGSISICGVDALAQPLEAKRLLGILPDRVRTFDRLTGRQLLHYYGMLRGLPALTVEERSEDLVRAFDLGDSLGRVVSDYSVGMTKKIMLAGAMIHSPRVLVLDEPFEAMDPASTARALEVLTGYVSRGGTVVLSSHEMDLLERECSRLAMMVGGRVLDEGSIDEVRGEGTLEERFVALSGGADEVEELEWLSAFSD